MDSRPPALPFIVPTKVEHVRLSGNRKPIAVKSNSRAPLQASVKKDVTSF